jgi:hypothetical protein
MMRSTHDYRTRRLGIIAILILWVSLLCPGNAWGEDTSGLSLTLNGDPDHAGNQYPLSNDSLGRIELIMVTKNISGWSIHTKRGFSNEELQKFLIVTDPGGTKHALNPETLALDPPPPLFWGDLAMRPAETLPRGWVRSITIDDLRELFPVMKSLAGWYTIEAHVPFLRYGWVIQDTRLGLLGVTDSPNNWSGTVNANKLQIEIVPPNGAHLKIQVLDNRPTPPEPLANVSVSVFRGNIAEEDLADAWNGTDAVLVGTTDPEGWVIWNEGASCQSQDDYTAIAFHQSEYKAAHFSQTEDWAEGCVASLLKEILFAAPPSANTFSVFAFNSVWIQSKAIVFSGNIGAQNASPGPWLNSEVEVSIGAKAEAKDGVQIFGDSVKIFSKAIVDDVFYNELENKGSILGETAELQKLPVLLAHTVSFPPNITPGKDAVTVKAKKTLDLEPGFYGDVKIKSKAILRLIGGTYHVKSLDLDPGAELICGGRAEIRIGGRLHTGPDAYVGPDGESGLGAKNLVLFVGGINGEDGALESEPMAAEVGIGNKIRANIYVPNGTLWIRENSHVEGSFIAKDVIIGEKVNVMLDSAF